MLVTGIFSGETALRAPRQAFSGERISSVATNPEITVRDRWIVDIVISFGNVCRVNSGSGRHGTRRPETLDRRNSPNASPTGLRPNGLLLVCRQHPPRPLTLPDAMPTHREQMENRYDRSTGQSIW